MMKKLFITFFAITLSVGMFAESNTRTPNNISESDSVQCLKHYSIYVLNLKKKMYDYSVDSWNYMFKNCPDAGARIYADGIKLYEHFYKEADTPQRKVEIVDTIMMIYDQRIKYFGNHPKYPEGWIRGRKALDIVKYRRGNSGAMNEAYQNFMTSFDMMGDKAEDVVLFTWLKTSSSLLSHGDIEEVQFINDYLTISTVLDVQMEKSTGQAEERKEKIIDGCEDLLVRSSVGDCSLVEPYLNDLFLADESSIVNMNRIVRILDKLGCNESSFYESVVEKNFVLNPSGKEAYRLAKMFVKRQEFNRAKEYYNKAIEMCEKDDFKAALFYELAVLDFAHFKNYSEARDLAKQSITLKEDWGKPYILIGNIYAAESNRYGKDEFDHSTVYWIALDKFSKAKTLDVDCEEEASRQIALYSQYLPDKETGFFHGLKEGDNFTINSWINETTKVRFR